MEFHDDEVVEVERLVERAGLPVVERLGLDAETPDEEIGLVVRRRVDHWRRRAAHPMAPRATVDAAGIVLRSYEGMLLEIPAR